MDGRTGTGSGEEGKTVNPLPLLDKTRLTVLLATTRLAYPAIRGAAGLAVSQRATPRPDDCAGHSR